MNKQEAAQALGVSPRAIERYVSAGSLPAQYIRGKTGKVLDITPEDLEQFRASLEAPVERPATPRQAPHNEASTSSTTTLATLDAPSNGTFSQGLTLQLLADIHTLAEELKADRDKPRQDAASLATKLTLSIDEAATLAGVSRGIIRAAIQEGSLSARIIGRGYRVGRPALERWVESLLGGTAPEAPKAPQRPKAAQKSGKVA